MQSRMDRYNTIESNDTNTGSRAKKNQELYEKIKTSDIKNYDVSNNMSVIKDNIKSVDLNKVHDFLDERYGDNTVKRRSIDLPEISNTQEIETIQDTKEYDINAILERAKQGKNIDYSKERLKKVRETQYEMLNSLDSEMAKLSTVERAQEKRKEQEENLKNLINTITEIELQNKMKDTSNDLELLSDLMGEPDDEKIGDMDSSFEDSLSLDLETIDITKELEDVKDEVKTEEKVEIPEIVIDDTTQTQEITKDLTDTTPDIVIGGVQEVQDTINNKVIRDQRVIETNDKKKDKPDKVEHIEETLSKLDIDLSTYDDFADINETDKSSTVIKIIIFVIFIALILGAVVILDNLLGLELLPF